MRIYLFFIGGRHKEFCGDAIFSFRDLSIDDRIKLILDQSKSLEDQNKSINDEYKLFLNIVKSFLDEM